MWEAITIRKKNSLFVATITKKKRRVLHRTDRVGNNFPTNTYPGKIELN